ncbi:MAG: GNAT family N-acetyltransferase [Alphaproteobacteria bacterium]|nr:GNAT family N-acetyltransferase [Alphaproteobacteria bacterium]
MAIAPLQDAAALAALHALCFERPWSAESFETLLTLPGVRALGGVLDDRPAGFILLRQAADEAEILTICVLKDARRQGVARTLFQTAISDLPDIQTVFIEVDVNNTEALRFYEDLGFQITGQRKGYYQHDDGTKSDALAMGYAVNSSTQR